MIISPGLDREEERKSRPLSPCTLICTLDDEQRCLGCGRTLEQISQWALMSAGEQWAVVDQLVTRREANDVQSRQLAETE